MKQLKKDQKFIKSKSRSVDWQNAPDVSLRLNMLISSLNLNWINPSQIHSFRSKNSKARAYARIWGLPKPWQLALEEKPHYIIEILSEKFDNLPRKKQDEVLLHELAHIPKTFSGALTPHSRKRKGSFHDKLKILINAYNKAR